MLIVVDIGNTNITLGAISKRKVLHKWRIATQLWRTEDEHFVLFREFLRDAGIAVETVQGAALSCVVPPLLHPVRDALTHLTGNACFVVEPGVKIGMNVHYRLPGHVGADRIVNAYAVKVYHGHPAIVIDFGTATTFCVIDKAGDYCGGVIYPGIRATSDALYQAAALLPRVTFKAPEEVVGKTTVSSIQSGMFYGYLDMIEGMISRIKSEYPEIRHVVSTGGLGKKIYDHTDLIDTHDPLLTLRGLFQLYHLNLSNEDSVIW